MKNLLKHPIISAVMAGVILWFLAWLGGFIPSVWAWLKQSSTILWSLVTYRLTLPVWLVVLISTPLMVWLLHVFNNRKAAIPKASPEVGDVSVPSEQPELTLTEDEFRVMRLFVSADGKSLQVSHIKHRLNFPVLKIEQIIEALEEKRLINVHSNYMHGTSFSLTRLGRDYMIGNDYDSAKQFV